MLQEADTAGKLPLRNLELIKACIQEQAMWRNSYFSSNLDSMLQDVKTYFTNLLSPKRDIQIKDRIFLSGELGWLQTD